MKNNYYIKKIKDISPGEVSNIEQISNNTENTWQLSRKLDEIKVDTINGKVAEELVWDFMERFLPENFKYITYDSIRDDNLKKHAPFDAIIYNSNLTSDKIVKTCIEQIRLEVKHGEYGNLSPKLRKYCECHKVYFVEIKSTKVNNKKLEAVCSIEKYTDKYFDKLIEEILNDDFLAYPHYCRSSYTINSWNDYVNYVKSKLNIATIKEAKSLALKKSLDNLSDILVRVYIDGDYAIIIGYTTKYDLLCEPIVGKCVSKKSANAVYYKQSLKERKTIYSLCEDKLLWD